jgi:thiol-disulfide isomerase/thioredoxin
MMHSIRISPALVLGTALFGLPTPGTVVAQERETGHCPGKLEALNASYVHQMRAIERRWIAELAELADKSSGPEANDAYRQLFNLAIARDLCLDAQPAAQSCLGSIPFIEAEGAARTCSASIPSGQDLRTLATSVQVFAWAEKGDYEQSLADLKALFKRPGCGRQPATKSSAATAFAVGEAYFQRLIRSGRYDVARKLCELACKDDIPATLRNHFEARRARLELFERPAPVISVNDVESCHDSLNDLKRKLVLVDFWESRCAHCVAAITALNALAQKYEGQGSATPGVSLDSRHPDVKDGTTALPKAHELPVRDGVNWMYLLDGQRAVNVRTAHGVEAIPANFPLSRAGRIFAMEHGDALEREVVRALGGLSGGLSR